MISGLQNWRRCLPFLIVFVVLQGFGPVVLTHIDTVAADTSEPQNVDCKKHSGWIPEVWKNYSANADTEHSLPDFSKAGYAMGERPLPEVAGPVFDVTASRFGAVPDDLKDDTLAIQAAINAAQENGGGVVYLPKGRYDIRKDPSLPGLRISTSNIVIRGAGQHQDGTVLHLVSPAPAGNIRRLGTVPATQAARSGAVLAIMGSEKHNYLTDITQDLKRGKAVVSVADSSLLKAGQLVVVSLTDPLIDSTSPAPEKAAIAAELTKPYKLLAEQQDTFGKAAREYTWIVQISEIIDRHTVRLSKTARFDHLQSYKGKIMSFHGVQDVGIENLRLESAWPGNYRHHKPYTDKNGEVVRTAKEQDYLWNGIWLSSAANGWVKNVTFNNLTQGIIASFVADSTFDKLSFIGQDGHAGITMGKSNDLLVSGVHFFAPLVHPVTLTMMSSGNVVTDSETHYDGRNAFSETDAVLDFHGLFPFENLFDTLRGFYVCPGGDMSVLPHGGVRNVFWNIVAPEKMSCYTEAESDEFFRTYATMATSSGSQLAMYEHLPQAFFIGITRKADLAVTIGNSQADRSNQWHVVEGLGRKGIGVESLYRAQVNRRQSREGETLPQ